MTETLERPTVQEYPQDALVVKSRRALKRSLAGLGAAVVIVGASWGGIAYANGVAATQAHTLAVAQQHQVDSARTPLTVQTQAAAAEADTTTADTAVATEQARAADALAAQQAAAALLAQQQASDAKRTHSSSTNNPKGTHLTWIPSSDPQNANGGDYVDPASFCASHSASTVGGVPVCD